MVYYNKGNFKWGLVWLGLANFFFHFIQWLLSEKVE